MSSDESSVTSAAMMPGPPELVTMARLGPWGRGWVEKAWARLKSPATSRTRMMPACENAAP